MRKAFLLIILLAFTSSCLSSINKERVKTLESMAASQRINNSDMNNKSVFDEME